MKLKEGENLATVKDFWELLQKNIMKFVFFVDSHVENQKLYELRNLYMKPSKTDEAIQVLNSVRFSFFLLL